MFKKLSLRLFIILLAFSLNGLVCCGPSFCSNNSGCHQEGPACDCCCLQSAGNLSAIASANPDPTDPVIVSDTTSIPSISTVKITVHKDCEIRIKDPRLMSKLNESKLFKLFISRKDFV